MTVEMQNNELETKFTLREIIEAANKAKIESEVVEAILKRLVSPESAKELVDRLVPSDSTGWQEEGVGWIPGSKKQVQRGFVG